MLKPAAKSVDPVRRTGAAPFAAPTVTLERDGSLPAPGRTPDRCRTKIGRGGSAAKQGHHRPGIPRTLGLRALG
jgi:hypothetical protein